MEFLTLIWWGGLLMKVFLFLHSRGISLLRIYESLPDREIYSGVRGISWVEGEMTLVMDIGIWECYMELVNYQIPKMAESVVSQLVVYQHLYLNVRFKFIPGICVFYLT